ncbi:uncharacterized protein LOC128961084 [Oppia nitens]|uniref:uncharacterized protein LOC128961084 n=1 Tax=Oppia nitens TaxID=1686743 RepID=UPI0023DCA404|nr:uncharacterized protein LOC128961084 [Oppia nitens]
MYVRSATSARQCRNETQMCGGFAGFQCCPGLDCFRKPLMRRVADGSGSCQKTVLPQDDHCLKRMSMCDEEVPNQCCQGLRCVEFDIDATGARLCRNESQSCGVFLESQCCSGLKCVGIKPGVSDDGSGRCQKTVPAISSNVGSIGQVDDDDHCQHRMAQCDEMATCCQGLRCVEYWVDGVHVCV